MKNTKRILSLLLIAAMTFTMTACASIGVLSDLVTGNNKELSRGVVNGNTYQSEFIGIQCTLDEEWTISNEDELAQFSGMTASQVNNENIKEALESGSTFFDFMATKDDGLTSINITMTEMKTHGYSGDSEEKLASAVYPEVKSMLSEEGFEDISIEQTTVVFAGKEHPCFNISATYYGIEIYEKIVEIIESNVSIGVTACSFMENTTDSLLAYFTAY